MTGLTPASRPHAPVETSLGVDAPAAHARHMARPDGCPQCVLNVEPPRDVLAVDGATRAAYLCSDCGHAWTTDWKDDPR